jgi:hypothetical protein
VARERCAGHVTSGVDVFTREHMPNILKNKGNLNNVKYGKQSMNRIGGEMDSIFW